MNYLPDVSIWLALVHEGHSHHSPVMTWFDTLQEDRLAFVCRVSQTGLLRLLTQTATMGVAVKTQREAWVTYNLMCEDSRISFALESVGFSETFERFSSRGEISPKLWTDDYLAAFATAGNLTLITLDRALAARVPAATLLTP